LVAAQRRGARDAPAAQHRVVVHPRTYNQDPLSFEPNVGQTAAQVQFLSRGPGYALYLTSDEAVLGLQQPSGTGNPATAAAAPSAPAVLTMQLVGANATAACSGLDKLASTTNYLGATQAANHTNIPNFGQVEYQNVYAGINLIYFGNQQQLEFNFVVAAVTKILLSQFPFQGFGQRHEILNDFAPGLGVSQYLFARRGVVRCGYTTK
jgi:hypothetical protein